MRQLLGGLLLAAGILIAGASGLCSAIYVVAGLGLIVQTVKLANAMMALLVGLGLLLFVGGIPFAVGMGLIKLGRWIRSDVSKPGRKGPGGENRD
ncbi:hypothetical protein [Novosphingobium sp.]|uniref:hypothetical protein n=1 Tax=Novosphingobium sp. TaxID=1874826 RepID=UPI003340FBA3